MPPSEILKPAGIVLMMDYRMIGVSKVTGSPTLEVDLPRGWINIKHDQHCRRADLGIPALNYVGILSLTEAQNYNARYKEKSGETKDWLAIDKVIRSLDQPGYFGSWVIVEGMDID